MRVRIEAAGLAEAAEAMELIHGVFVEYGFTWAPQEEFWDLLASPEAFPYRDPQGAMWVMRDETQAVVGSIAVEQLDDSTAELHRLYLDARLRGSGYGRELFLLGVDWARRKGMRRIVLWSDTRFLDAHRLYERLGYARTGERRLADVNQTVEYRYERLLGSESGAAKIDHDH